METLYKRNAKGDIIFWDISKTEGTNFRIKNGILGKTGMIEDHSAFMKGGVDAEIKSRYKAKLKEGYKALSDVADTNELPNRNSAHSIFKFLDTYLPKHNTTDLGMNLPMLAKVFQYDKNNYPMFAQPKINGLRAICRVVNIGAGMFPEQTIEFRSREGNKFNLNKIFIERIKQEIESNYPDLWRRLVEYENFELDGELYVHGKSVNDINHIVKSGGSIELHYFVYDLAVEDILQCTRLDLLGADVVSKPEQVTALIAAGYNNCRFIKVSSTICNTDNHAREIRDVFVKAGYEGVILRNPLGEYQFDKRNMTMIKFKPMYEGTFEIVNIVKELKRETPIFICRNDINDFTFEVILRGNREVNKQYLVDKEKYIGGKIDIEYRERSGIHQFPFHTVGLRVWRN